LAPVVHWPVEGFRSFYPLEIDWRKMAGQFLKHAHGTLSLVLACKTKIVVGGELGLGFSSIVVLVGGVVTWLGGLGLYVHCKAFVSLC
jgi:hypothetical protein